MTKLRDPGPHHRRGRHIVPRLAPLLMAALGATAGLLVTLPAASACDCAPFEWRLQLQSVTSSEPTANHQSFWPPQAKLTSYTGHVHLWAATFASGIIALASVDQ